MGNEHEIRGRAFDSIVWFVPSRIFRSAPWVGTNILKHLIFPVNLPELLAHTAMDPETVAVLKDNIASFLRFVQYSLLANETFAHLTHTTP